MDLNLKDKVIVVTGGSKGIGNSIAQVLAEEQAIVVIIGRNLESVEKAVAELKQKGGQAFCAIAELTDAKQCKSALDQIVEQYGRIDGLVNNAGVNDAVGLEEGSPEAFVESINKNVTHYYTMAHYALPYLKKSKGAIVNIGSKTSVTGQGGTSGYAAANGARNSLTREWALELLPYQIRVNAIIIAECMTPLYNKWLNSFENPKEKLAAIESKIPLGKRMTTGEEIANTAVFLLSEKASHTTGQLLYVDGGYTHLDRSIS